MNRKKQILETAKSMIAMMGFEGISMRELAAQVGITPAALYHYFATKQSLLVATVNQAHIDTPNAAVEMLNISESKPEEKLYRFIRRLCERFAEDPDFLRLLEHAMLNQDPQIRRALSDSVFEKYSRIMEDFLEKMTSDYDKYLLSISVVGLVVHHYKTSMLRRELPSYEPNHDDPEYVAQHIMKVLRGNIFK